MPRSASVSEVAVLRMMRSVSVGSKRGGEGLVRLEDHHQLDHLGARDRDLREHAVEDLALESDDRVGERGGVGEARLRVLGDGAIEDVARAPAAGPAAGSRPGRRLRDDAADQPRRVVVVERHAPREHLVEEDAHRVDVGRTLGARPASSSGARNCGVPGTVSPFSPGDERRLDRDAEVHEARLSVLADDDVLGLQVAVQHADPVGRREAAADPLGDREAAARAEASAPSPRSP